MLARIIRNRHLLRYGFESLYELSIAKFCIIFLPFQYWKKNYGYFQCETLKTEVTPHHQQLKMIRRAVQYTARCVPWRSKCLDQAMAAQRMLQRRRLSNTLYFGMIKNVEQQWAAHAWIRCGDIWLLGYQPHMPYTVVGTYAWIPQ